MAHVAFAKTFSMNARMQKGVNIALQLNLFKKNSSRESAVSLFKSKGQDEIDNVVDREINSEWGPVFNYFIRCCIALSSHDLQGAHDHAKCCFENFMTVLRGSSRWVYPICRTLAVVLRIMATRMDTKLLKSGNAKAATCRSNAAGLFRQCIADHLRDPEGSVLTSRSYLTLLMVNQCMRLFMQLATYKHCRSITLPAQPPLSAYPMSERVTYAYFMGRLDLLDDNLEAAEQQLSFAFRCTPKDDTKHRSLILRFLVPCKLLLYQRPTVIPSRGFFRIQHLSSFDLNVYRPILSACMIGSMHRFEQVLQQEMPTLVKWGVYLLFERCKLTLYRNLFMSAHALLCHPTHIKLATLAGVLRVACQDQCNEDEAECIIATLIARSLMKGCISSLHSTVVLRKEDPFRKKS